MATQQNPDPEAASQTASAAANAEGEQESTGDGASDTTDLPTAGDGTVARSAAVEKVDVDQAELANLEPTEIELLKAEVSELTNKLIDSATQLSDAHRDIAYAKAETQTAIRRAREDASRALNRAKRELMTRLMNVADTFHHTGNELSNIEKDEKTEIVVTAVQMAIKEFDKVLNGEGLELLNPLDQGFDPQFHEAQATVPTEAKEPGTIIDVLRVGYLLDGNVLRAPQVVVAAEAVLSRNEDTSDA